MVCTASLYIFNRLHTSRANLLVVFVWAFTFCSFDYLFDSKCSAVWTVDSATLLTFRNTVYTCIAVDTIVLPIAITISSFTTTSANVHVFLGTASATPSFIAIEAVDPCGRSAVWTKSLCPTTHTLLYKVTGRSALSQFMMIKERRL